MEKKLLINEIKVYSEKHNINGIIRDYGMVVKLFFTYNDNEIVMGIKRNYFAQRSFDEIGREIIDSYIDNLAAPKRKLQLHYWYIDEQEYKGEMLKIGHGVVTGHKKIADSVKVRTEKVKMVYLDETKGELILSTQKSNYHCPLEYCRFDKQDNNPDLIPDYEDVKKKYKDRIEYPSIEPGKILLVLSNFSRYYFHSIYYQPENSEKKEALPYNGFSHIGTFQDSYLIDVEGTCIQLRYFPHYQNIEFYCEYTEDKPWYIENIGDVVLYADTSKGLIKLSPGERKEVTEENAEKEKPMLPAGDLYPAGTME